MRGRLLTALGLAALFCLGAVLGLWGAFLVPLHLLGAYGWSVGIALVGNLALPVLGAAGTGRLAGAFVPAAGWLVAVGFTTWSPGGDVILPSSVGGAPGVGDTGSLFPLVGMAAAGLGIVWAQRRLSRPPAPAAPASPRREDPPVHTPR